MTLSFIPLTVPPYPYVIHDVTLHPFIIRPSWSNLRHTVGSQYVNVGIILMGCFVDLDGPVHVVHADDGSILPPSHVHATPVVAVWSAYVAWCENLHVKLCHSYSDVPTHISARYIFTIEQYSICQSATTLICLNKLFISTCHLVPYSCTYPMVRSHHERCQYKSKSSNMDKSTWDFATWKFATWNILIVSE